MFSFLKQMFTVEPLPAATSTPEQDALRYRWCKSHASGATYMFLNLDRRGVDPDAEIDKALTSS